jgi:hypothetical protein
MTDQELIALYRNADTKTAIYQFAEQAFARLETLIAERDRLTGQVNTLRELRKLDHDAIIEQCAKVAEAEPGPDGRYYETPKEIAAAIRALKQEPGK